MSKLWMITVRREIEDDFIYHIRQEKKPTRERIIRDLAEDYYINDNPDYTEYEVEEITT